MAKSWEAYGSEFQVGQLNCLKNITKLLGWDANLPPTGVEHKGFITFPLLTPSPNVGGLLPSQGHYPNQPVSYPSNVAMYFSVIS